jgi:hypothetical protein
VVRALLIGHEVIEKPWENFTFREVVKHRVALSSDAREFMRMRNALCWFHCSWMQTNSSEKKMGSGLTLRINAFLSLYYFLEHKPIVVAE